VTVACRSLSLQVVPLPKKVISWLVNWLVPGLLKKALVESVRVCLCWWGCCRDSSGTCRRVVGANGWMWQGWRGLTQPGLAASGAGGVWTAVDVKLLACLRHESGACTHIELHTSPIATLCVVSSCVMPPPPRPPGPSSLHPFVHPRCAVWGCRCDGGVKGRGGTVDALPSRCNPLECGGRAGGDPHTRRTASTAQC